MHVRRFGGASLSRHSRAFQATCAHPPRAFRQTRNPGTRPHTQPTHPHPPAPVLQCVVGVYDRDMAKPTHNIEVYPKIYEHGLKHLDFSITQFLAWLGQGTATWFGLGMGR